MKDDDLLDSCKLKRVYLLCVMRMISNWHFLARFEVLKALLIKIPFSWDKAPCRLEYTFKHFSGP